MKTMKHMLVVINVDSFDDQALQKKLRYYYSIYHPKISLLYVITDPDPQSYQLSDMVIGHPVLIKYALSFAKIRQKYPEARKNLACFAEKTAIAAQDCYLAAGCLHREAKRVALKIGADLVIGDRPNLYEMFQQSRVYSIIKKFCKYIATLCVGYHPKAKIQHNAPFFQ